MSENKSGIFPTEDRVLILPDELVVKVQGKKIEGIILPDDISNKQADAGVLGTLVAFGPTAWKESGQTPLTVNTKVMFARYQGLKTTGLDEQEYRLMYDRDIIAVVDPKLEVELA